MPTLAPRPPRLSTGGLPPWWCALRTIPPPNWRQRTPPLAPGGARGTTVPGACITQNQRATLCRRPAGPRPRPTGGRQHGGACGGRCHRPGLAWVPTAASKGAKNRRRRDATAVRPDTAAAANTEVATARVGRRLRGAATSGGNGDGGDGGSGATAAVPGVALPAAAAATRVGYMHPTAVAAQAGGGEEANRPPPPLSVRDRVPAPVRRPAERLRGRGVMPATVDVEQRP